MRMQLRRLRKPALSEMKRIIIIADENHAMIIEACLTVAMNRLVLRSSNGNLRQVITCTKNFFSIMPILIVPLGSLQKT